MSDQNQNKVNLNSTEGPNLTIHSIFVKDISYESPSTPEAFSLPWEPQVKFDVQVMRRALNEINGPHEVVLHTTISSKLKTNDHSMVNPNSVSKEQEVVAFVIDVKLAGIFTIKGLSGQDLDRVLSTTAPTILFPYVAETIASLIIRGGFPQFILPPIDFATLYQQRLDNQNMNEEVTDKHKKDEITVN